MFEAVGDAPQDAAMFANLAINFEAKLINITQRVSISLTDPETGIERDLTLEERLKEVFENEGAGSPWALHGRPPAADARRPRELLVQGRRRPRHSQQGRRAVPRPDMRLYQLPAGPAAALTT